MALLGVGWADSSLGRIQAGVGAMARAAQAQLARLRGAGVLSHGAVRLQSAAAPRPGCRVLQLGDRILRRRAEAHRRLDRADSQRQPARSAAERRQEGHAHLVLAAENAARRAGVALPVSAAREQRIPGRAQELPRAQFHEPESRRLARRRLGLSTTCSIPARRPTTGRCRRPMRYGRDRSGWPDPQARRLRVADQRDRKIQ